MKKDLEEDDNYDEDEYLELLADLGVLDDTEDWLKFQEMDKISMENYNTISDEQIEEYFGKR